MGAVILLAFGCGRRGFEPSDLDATAGSGTAGDGGPLDAAMCPTPPCLVYGDFTSNGDNTVWTVTWSYRSIPGPLMAELVPAPSFADPITVPIADQQASWFFGSLDCSQCFVRLTANGIVVDGPVGDYRGN